MKPFAESCEQNKQPILQVLKTRFADVKSVLEIGSGTGQHAVYFAAHLPHLRWLTSDVQAQQAGIQAWLREAGLDNLTGPMVLDVNQPEWPVVAIDAVFSANTVHIIDWPGVENMFAGIGRVLRPQGVFCLYGPFNYGGGYTCESNAEFDRWLQTQDPNSAIRDFEALNELADAHDLVLIEDHAMPANNHILVWQKAQIVER